MKYILPKRKNRRPTLLEYVEKNFPEILKQNKIKIVKVKDVIKNKKITGTTANYVWIDEFK